MSTLQETALETQYAELEAVFGDRLVLSWRQCAVVGLACLLFLLISYTPLAPSSTWLLASRGEAILQTGRLPQVDVTQPLSQGLPYRETSWLSSIFWALIARQSIEAVSWTITLLAVVSLVLSASMIWGLTRSSLLAAAGLGWLALLLWPQWSQGSPFLLVLPIWLLLISVQISFGSKLSAWGRAAATIALIFLWANLDASVWIGIALVAVGWGTAASEALCRDRDGRNVMGDREFRLATLTLEHSLLASLLTPLGLQLWTGYWEQLAASQWNTAPLAIVSLAGLGWLTALVVLAVIVRKHSGALPWRELAPVSLLALGSLVYAPLIAWFAPLAVVVLLPRLQKACGLRKDPAAVQASPEPVDAANRPMLKFAYTLTAGLLCWIAFALSPLSQPLLGGQPRSVSQLLDRATPLAAIHYLRENPVPGLVFAPAIWGDLLQSRYGASVKVFATTRQSSLPQQAVFDYGRLARGEVHWETTAQRYGIDALVIDKQSQPMLLEAVGEGNENWQVVLNDDQALVVRRRGV